MTLSQSCDRWGQTEGSGGGFREERTCPGGEQLDVEGSESTVASPVGGAGTMVKP